MLSMASPIMLQSLENCDLDMTVQECIEAQLPVPKKPPQRYLSSIDAIYLTEAFLTAIAARVVKEFTNSIDNIWSKWSTWVIIVLEGVLFGWAGFLITWYLVNGPETEEYQSDKTVMVAFMEDYCRNWGFYIHLLGILTYLVQGIVDGDFV